MAENSKIQWTDATFNPWIGCTKISPACTNCYAAVDTFARTKRSQGIELWGPRAERHRTSEANWKNPLAWNRKAEKEGRRIKVFCASLADVFEDHHSLHEWRDDLFELIKQTPHLDWLLLTKRPENVAEMVPDDWFKYVNDGTVPPGGKLKSLWPNNVWIGTTVENQEQANKRIPDLLKIPARIRFLSIEPMLERIDLMGWLASSDVKWVCTSCKRRYPHTRFAKETCPDCGAQGYWTESHDGNYNSAPGISWIICGGESGHHARPMHPDWARSLRDKCVSSGVPFFFKQWGEWMPFEATVQPPFYRSCATGEEYDSHGMDFIDPETSEAGKWNGHRWMDLFEAMDYNEGENEDVQYLKTGKSSWRLLDGKEWGEFPKQIQY